MGSLSGSPNRRTIAAGAVLATASLLACLTGCSTGQTIAEADPKPPPASTAAPTPSAASTVSAEDKARADLDALVRNYYAAENAVFLDSSLSPSAALEPFLMNPALGARIAHLLAFRNDGHVAESSTANIHSLDVTELSLSASPPMARVEECGTISLSGVDAETDEHRTVTRRGLTIWTARLLPDGSWRLTNYDNPEARPC